MIQTTVLVAVRPDLRGQYRKIIQSSGRNVEPFFAIRDTRSRMESQRMEMGERRDEKKEEDKVCIFERDFSTEKERREIRNA
jgi:hypothetical protein